MAKFTKKVAAVVEAHEPDAVVEPAVVSSPPDQFELCLPFVLAHEGGYVNHPNDPGGATNLGISLRYAKTRGSLMDLDGDGDVDADDIRLITIDDAAPRYQSDFWDAVSADKLPPGVDYTVFDYAVNSGPARAIKTLQRAVGATVDGRIGPQTLGAIATYDPLQIIEIVSANRMAFLRGLPNWGDFGRGWTRRVEQVMGVSHRMVLGMELPA